MPLDFGFTLEGNLDQLIRSSEAIMRGLDGVIAEAAEDSKKLVKGFYRSSRQQANSRFTNEVIDFHIRNISGGNPLNKSGGLVDAVIAKRESRLSYLVTIDDDAMTDGRRPYPYKKVAALMESGFVIPVTPNVIKFFKYLKTLDPENVFIPYNKSAISVPARPVWTKAYPIMTKNFDKKITDFVNSALHGSGKITSTKSISRLSTPRRMKSTSGFRRLAKAGYRNAGALKRISRF